VKAGTSFSLSKKHIPDNPKAAISEWHISKIHAMPNLPASSQ
jgi:hypothetical protein